MAGSLNHRHQLNQIFQRLSAPGTLADLMPEVEPLMLAYLNAERITIYQKSRWENDEIIVRIHNPDRQNTDADLDIRLPMNPKSIAGYVAMSHRALRIQDVYDTEELTMIFPGLAFDKSYDEQSGFRTRAMMVVPIKFGNVLLGLLQVINRAGEGTFEDRDLAHAQEMARVLGHKFRLELQITRGPFDHLLETGILTSEELARVRQSARQTGGDEQSNTENILLYTLQIAPVEIGRSLEQFYQIPYMGFDATHVLPEALMAPLNPGYLKRQMWLPVAGDQEQATILVQDPTNTTRLMQIQRMVKAEQYTFRVGLQWDILSFLGEPLTPLPPPDPARVAREAPESAEASEPETEDDGIHPAPTEEEPETAHTPDPAPSRTRMEAARLVTQLIILGIRSHASDLYIETGKEGEPGVAKMRVADDMRTLATLAPDQVEEIMAQVKRMGRLDVADKARPQAGLCKAKSDGKMVELRIITYPTDWGETANLQIIPK
jgi:hypothetical protein